MPAAMMLASPGPAHAQPSPKDVGLHYEVDETARECPSEAELRAAIVQRLGSDPFADTGASESYIVHVQVAREGAGLAAQLEWLDKARVLLGQRRLSSEDQDCLELARGVAFAVAVQLQLRAGTPAPPPAAPAPKPAPAKRLAPPPPRAPEHSLLVGLGGLACVGSQPGVAAGLHTFAALGGRAWAVALDAHATLPTTEQRPGGGSFSGREVGASAAPCFRSGMLDACAVAALTVLSVQGKGVDQSRRPSAVGFGVGLRLQLAWPWGKRLAGVAHVDALAQLTQRDVLLNRETVWSTAPVTLAIGLDMAAIFR